MDENKTENTESVEESNVQELHPEEPCEGDKGNLDACTDCETEKPKRLFVDVAQEMRATHSEMVEGSGTFTFSVSLDLEGPHVNVMRDSDAPVPMDVLQRLVYFLEEEKHKTFQFIAQSFYANEELPEQQENNTPTEEN